MKKHTRVLVFISCFLVLFLTGVVFAETKPAAVIILDASGSMWGKAGNETKIEAARKVLSEIVPALPDSLETGFVAFGHRKEGDCNDIEILVPIGSGNREEIVKKARSLKPKGKTPLALSVELVADTLKARDADTTILMISDGKDTCSTDPCAVVKKLKESGIRFVLHVVGFDVQDDESEQLRCMANAGGGEYYAADDTESLLAAFKEMQKSVEKSLVVVPAETKTVGRKTSLAKVRVAMPESAVKSLAFYKFTGKDGKTIKTVEDPKADMTHSLPSGEYTIVLGYANPNYQEATEVRTKTFKAEGESSVFFGALLFNIAKPLEEAVRNVIIRDSEGEQFSLTNEYHGNGYYLFTPKPLPEGEYNVEFAFSRNEEKPVPFTRALSVEEGKETVLEVASGIVMKKTEEKVEGWDIVPSGEDTPLFEIRRGFDNDEPLWRHFPVPPGKYDIIFHIKGMDQPLVVGEAVEIGKGEIVSFDTGM